LNIWWTLSYGAKHVWKFLQFPTLIRYCETDNGEIISNIFVHHFLVAKCCQGITTFFKRCCFGDFGEKSQCNWRAGLFSVTRLFGVGVWEP
jgi:hypothetical protein